ncbi:MAG: methyltransferase domain-containing protein [candidate division KSB1 bacterium]|nr:methyltransferase domain-containing protein [candidate division KSB1 bacterium]
MVSSNTNNSLLFRWLGVLRCPQCRDSLEIEIAKEVRALLCAQCSGRYEIENGIPRLILPAQAKRIEKFCEQYDALRLQEGWASEVPEYYAQLPFRDLSGRHEREWQWRAASFRFLENWLEQTYGKRLLQILDAGAGSGWMSRLLAERHEVLAVDVNAGPHGLASLPREKRKFMAVQAELQRLPIADNCFDVAIANASLHYLQHPQEFFMQARRLIRPGGKLVVMDSPTYPTADAALAAQQRTRDYYSQLGAHDWAEHYRGLLPALFANQPHFRFARLRGDFDRLEFLKKWVREKLGKPIAARFPIWVGERLPDRDEFVGQRRPRAGALIIHENKLLTFFRQRATAPPSWRIPGGGIEADESPAQAARREVREETGLDIHIGDLCGRYFYRGKTEWYFWAKTELARLPEDDSIHEGPARLQWLPLAKLAECDLRPPGLKWELVEYFNQSQ